MSPGYILTQMLINAFREANKNTDMKKVILKSLLWLFIYSTIGYLFLVFIYSTFKVSAMPVDSKIACVGFVSFLWVFTSLGIAAANGNEKENGTTNS